MEWRVDIQTISTGEATLTDDIHPRLNIRQRKLNHNLFTRIGYRWLLPLLVCASARPSVASDSLTPTTEFATVHIPRVASQPKIEDFLTMEPSPAWQGKLAK